VHAREDFLYGVPFGGSRSLWQEDVEDDRSTTGLNCFWLPFSDTDGLV
jgi:hypothetical protein